MSPLLLFSSFTVLKTQLEKHTQKQPHTLSIQHCRRTSFILLVLLDFFFCLHLQLPYHQTNHKDTKKAGAQEDDQRQTVIFFFVHTVKSQKKVIARSIPFCITFCNSSFFFNANSNTPSSTSQVSFIIFLFHAIFFSAFTLFVGVGCLQKIYMYYFKRSLFLFSTTVSIHHNDYFDLVAVVVMVIMMMK